MEKMIKQWFESGQQDYATKMMICLISMLYEKGQASLIADYIAMWKKEVTSPLVIEDIKSCGFEDDFALFKKVLELPETA